MESQAEGVIQSQLPFPFAGIGLPAPSPDTRVTRTPKPVQSGMRAARIIYGLTCE